MALKVKEKGVTYVDLKEHTYADGKRTYGFVLSSERKSPNPTIYEKIDGVITGIYYKDENYEGNEYRKCYITISDDEGSYRFGVNTSTKNYESIISFLANTNINEKLELVPVMNKVDKEGSDIMSKSILVSQNGKYMKSYFHEHKKDVPQWTIVQVGKKKVVDKTEYLDYIEDFVNKSLIPKIKSNAVVSDTIQPTQHIEDQIEDDDDVTTTSDLPWD